MTKYKLTTFLFALVFIGVSFSCKKTVVPVSQRIAKAWTAQQVTENGTPTYTKGATNNVRPGYTNFSLDLSKPPTVIYREFDGNTFTGQYSLPDDNTLTLTGLSPQPTGTNGTITFTINSLSDTELKLTRTTASQKTGNSSNVYTLTTP